MFKIDLFDFAVFNVADIFITVFSLLFIFYIIFGGENRSRKDEEDEVEVEEELRPGFGLREDIEFTMGAAKTAKPERQPQSAERVREEKPERRISRRSVEEPEKTVMPSREPKPRYEFEYSREKPAKKRVRTEADDPFAAWERASAAAETAESPASKLMETKPRRSVPAQPTEERPVRSVKPVRAPAPVEEKPVRTPAPVEEKPVRPAAPKASKKRESELGEEFSLDDILAEFRD